MRLHIEQREREGIIILDLKGPLTLGHGDLELREDFRTDQSGKVNIILNVENVSQIDSTGLGTLVGLPGCERPGEGWAGEPQPVAFGNIPFDQTGHRI